MQLSFAWAAAGCLLTLASAEPAVIDIEFGLWLDQTMAKAKPAGLGDRVFNRKSPQGGGARTHALKNKGLSNRARKHVPQILVEPVLAEDGNRCASATHMLQLVLHMPAAITAGRRALG